MLSASTTRRTLVGEPQRVTTTLLLSIPQELDEMVAPPLFSEVTSDANSVDVPDPVWHCKIEDCLYRDVALDCGFESDSLPPPQADNNVASNALTAYEILFTRITPSH